MKITPKLKFKTSLTILVIADQSVWLNILFFLKHSSEENAQPTNTKAN